MFFNYWNSNSMVVNVLKILSSQHEKWVRISRSFGLGPEAEDLVQDMYLKVYEWKGKYNKTLMYNENEVNYYFVFVVLKNLFNDKMRKENKKCRYIDHKKDKSFMELSIEYQEQMNIIKQEINSWPLYEKKIYELIYQEGLSMLELAKKTGIDYYSIYRTKKKIEKTLNLKLIK